MSPRWASPGFPAGAAAAHRAAGDFPGLSPSLDPKCWLKSGRKKPTRKNSPNFGVVSVKALWALGALSQQSVIPLETSQPKALARFGAPKIERRDS